MGPVICQIVTWKSNRPEKMVDRAWGNYVMLNTNRMSDILQLDSGNTKFKYLQAPNDHRCSWDTLECNTAIGQIEAAADTEPDHEFGVFPIFPTLDITRVTIDTPVDTEIDWEDVCMVYQTDRDATLGVSHMVYYTKSWKRVTVIVNLTINGVNDLWHDNPD